MTNDESSSDLPAGRVLDTGAFDIPLEPIAADDLVEGRPASGFVDLAELSSATVGLWEITPGTVTDVESDELFVVLSGRAELEIDGQLPLQLEPGSLVRLTEGMTSRWTVHETLRKLYIA
jgi:uncharacterized cupin superfamily protein